MQRVLPYFALLVAMLCLVAAACGEPESDTTPAATAAPLTPTPEPPGMAALGTCDSIIPAGEVAMFPFACIDRPLPGHSVSGPVAVRGHAALAPGNRVTVEIRDPRGSVLAFAEAEFTPRGPGMPGPWQATVNLPPNVNAGPGTVAVYFRDAAGKVTAEGTANVELEKLLPPTPTPRP